MGVWKRVGTGSSQTCSASSVRKPRPMGSNWVVGICLPGYGIPLASVIVVALLARGDHRCTFRFSHPRRPNRVPALLMLR